MNETITPVADESATYVLGTHDAELQRLGFQHQCWRAQAYALWERAGFRSGHTLLDFGCGPGFATLDLAALAGRGGQIIAADISPRFLAHLAAHAKARDLSNIETRCGDVQALDLPAASIDGAYCRWVLCFIADPERAIARVARALRPGAAFAIQEYYHYRAATIAPPSDAFDRMIAATAESWRVRGGDSDIGRRLPAMLRRCGLSVREVRPIVRFARPNTSLWQWPGTFFGPYANTLVQMGLITRADQAAYEADWAARSGDPDAFLSTPPVVDIIATK